jgi:hypothetical protein
MATPGIEGKRITEHLGLVSGEATLGAMLMVSASGPAVKYEEKLREWHPLSVDLPGLDDLAGLASHREHGSTGACAGAWSCGRFFLYIAAEAERSPYRTLLDLHHGVRPCPRNLDCMP